MKEKIKKTIEALAELERDLSQIDFKKIDIQSEVSSCEAKKKLIEAEIEKLKAVQEQLKKGVDESKRALIDDLNKRAAKIALDEEVSAKRLIEATKKEKQAEGLNVRYQLAIKEAQEKKMEYEELSKQYEEKLEKIKQVMR